MNHSLKMMLRDLSHKSKVFSSIYKRAAGRKVKATADMDDESFLKMRYRENVGKELNLENPTSFNEKLQWLKLHNRKPIYTQMADKYGARDYIASIIGEEYLIPCYGVWDRFEDIDFESLPDQFVLKCNHDCGSVFICKNKAEFDIELCRKKINSALKKNYYHVGREWPYKDIQPRIYAEKYLDDHSGRGLIDYKVMCFNAEAKFLFVCTNRGGIGHPNATLYDFQWQKLPFEMTYESDPKEIAKPQNLLLMKELAEKLAQGVPHLRVDFYEMDGKLYVGELTFYHAGGMGWFKPEEWNETLGSWIDLSKV